MSFTVIFDPQEDICRFVKENLLYRMVYVLSNSVADHKIGRWLEIKLIQVNNRFSCCATECHNTYTI